jgi:ABC-2 type transport system permease protein
MNVQHIGAMARKEWWHLLRDPQSLALILLMPMMLLFLFGYAIRLDIEHAPIGMLQEASDAASSEIAGRFEGTHAFDVTRYADRKAMFSALQRGDIWGGVIIPSDYARKLAAGDARIQLLLDGVDANTARLVRNYAIALVDNYALDLYGMDPPVRIEDRTWFNETKESKYAIIPGVIALVMAVIGALMTSLTVAREMEQGNLVMLRTTHLTRAEFLIGKLTPYFAIGMADLVVAVLAAQFIFEVPLRGSIIALALMSALFIIVVTLQGALISVTAGNQMLASQMSLISTFLPAFLLSGFVFAIENMPWVLQLISHIVPARYYVSLTKAIFLKGVSPFLLWTQGAALVLMLVILAAITMRRARKLGLLS